MLKMRKSLSLLMAVSMALSIMTTVAWAATDGEGIDTLAELQAALDSSTTPITLTGDIIITESIYICYDAVIDGAGHTIDASGTAGESVNDKQHGIVARAADVTLKNMTILGAKGYGIQVYSVNGGNTLTLDSVTVKNSKKGGLLANIVNTTTGITGCTFTNNAWGDVEVVPTCSFSASSTSFNSNPAVWVDGVTVAELEADTDTAINGDWLEDYTATDVSKGDKNFVYFVKNQSVTPPTDNDRPSSPSPSENVANTPATINKIEKTVETIAELGSIDTAKLPAGVTTATTASGTTVAAVPVTLYGGSADLGMEIINTIGGNSKVALNLSISTGLSGSTVKILLPGGFGKITEPGRIGYSFDYKAKADNDEKMLKAVKTEGATSVTAKIGGNHTLPVKATFTVSTKVADGKTVNIYKYDPHTNKLISVGTAKAVGGKLTFSTAIMGEMLFTTGTI